MADTKNLTLRIALTDPLPASEAVIPNRGLPTVNNLRDLMGALLAGRLNGSSLRCDVEPVAASNVVTIADAAGTVSMTVSGVSFSVTADADDTVTAAALAALVNASTNALVQGQVTAAAGGADHSATVTTTAIGSAVGVSGNAITQTATGTGTSSAHARLVGGTDGTAQVALTQASGTVTFSSASGTLVVTINGVALSQTDSTDSGDGDTLCNQIALDPVLSPDFQGVNASGVVTISAKPGGRFDGVAGNAVTLVVSGTGLSRSGALLTGGLDPISTRFSF